LLFGEFFLRGVDACSSSMVELIREGERATWPKVPAIRVTTRIGRALDRILHDFEAEEAHWLESVRRSQAGRKARRADA